MTGKRKKKNKITTDHSQQYISYGTKLHRWDRLSGFENKTVGNEPKNVKLKKK